MKDIRRFKVACKHCGDYTNINLFSDENVVIKFREELPSLEEEIGNLKKMLIHISNQITNFSKQYTNDQIDKQYK